MRNEKVESSEDNSYNPAMLIGIVFGLGLLLCFGLFIYNQAKSSIREVQLTAEEQAVIANVRLASAKNALDGGGNFTEDECNELTKISKRIDSKNDFVDCSYPDSIYLSTPDTSNDYVLIVSDRAYTATFTTDKKLTVLHDYSFIHEKSAGYNKSGGRE